MPWHVQFNHPECSERYAVVVNDSGKVVGCHPTRKAADKQVAALYANVPEARGEHMSSEFFRTFPLDAIRILSRAQGAEYADGRTVEAYAAVFDSPTEIHDGQGHYMETIDRAAFNKAIADARPQGNRTSWNIPVMYNHGMTIHGTPSDRGSMPIGAPLDIRADGHGLLTISRYGNNPLADEVLDGIASGAITRQSFAGRIVRSNPNPPRGGYRPSSSGLPTVRRQELGLREYGPTPFAAYADATIVGVRAALAQLLSTTQPSVELDEPDENDTSSDEDAVPDEPTAAGDHSGRDLHRAAVLERIAAAKRTRPGLTRQEGNP